MKDGNFGQGFGSLPKFFLILGVTLLSSSLSTAQERDTPKLVRQEGSGQITGLRWKSTKKLPFKKRFTQNGTRLYVSVIGKMSRQGWSLIWRKRKVRMTKGGVFRLRVPIYRAKQRVNLFAIGPDGEAEQEKLVIHFPGWKEELETEELEKSWYFVPGIGITDIKLDDSRITNTYTSKAVTVKATYRYLISPPKWDIGGTVYFTAVPFSQSDVTFGFGNNTQTANARFLGVNFRIGYKLPLGEPWGLSILAGTYFITMMTSNDSPNTTTDAFGVQNVAGPQIFPVLRRSFEGGSSMHLYGKFSPVSDQLSISFSNREIAGGIGYSFGNDITATFDYSNLNITLDGTEIKVTTMTLGASYSI